MVGDRISNERMEELGWQLAALFPRLALVLIRKFDIDVDMAEEVVSALFFRIMEEGQSRRRKGGAAERVLKALDDGYIEAYLTRAVANEYRDALRRSAREAVGLERLRGELCVADVSPGRIEPAVFRLWRQQADEAAIVRLEEAVARLGEPYRRIILRLLEDDLSLAEVARREGMKQGSIYTQYRRALVQLQRALAKE